MTFSDATRVVPVSDGEYRWEVPPGWAQGRGAWGGLVAAAFIGAIDSANDDRERTVRSVSAEIVAPARVGTVTISVRMRRRGSALSVWHADAVDAEGGLVGSLAAVLAAPRRDLPPTDAWGLAQMPVVPGPQDVPVVAVGPPLGPEFMQRMEFRPLEGIPVSGSAARTRGWARLADPVEHTAASLIAMVDAWWPAFLPALGTPRPIATINFSANLCVDPVTVPADEPLLHTGWATAMHDGFASEARQLWTADGRLAVDNLQSVVLIA